MDSSSAISSDDSLLTSFNGTEDNTTIVETFSASDQDTTTGSIDEDIDDYDTSALSDWLLDSLVNVRDASNTCTHSADTDEQSSECKHGDNQPLYNGLKLTTFQSYLLLMKYGLHHGLTKLELSDLLNLEELHLPRIAWYLYVQVR